MHSRFSLPLLFPHNFYHSSINPSQQLQPFRMNSLLQLMGSSWAAENNCSGAWSLLLGPWYTHPFLFLTLLLSPSCVIYPFLKVFPQQHHSSSTTSSPGKAELWHTESAAEVTGSGCDRHWAAPVLFLQPAHHKNPTT